jgi:hypothetical protein
MCYRTTLVGRITIQATMLLLSHQTFAQTNSQTAADTTRPVQSRPCDSTSTLSDSSQATDQERQWQDYDLARTYAPILRFAPPERLYPTVPFFTAFDTLHPEIMKMSDTLGIMSLRKNKSNHLTQEQLDTLALEVDTLAVEPLDAITGTMGQPIRTRRPWLPSFGYVKRRYQITPATTPSGKVIPVPAVFYRVCDLRERSRTKGTYSDVQKLWRYLRSDEQAWQRFGMDSLAVSDSTAFRVIEYFFYYVADAGLQGHSDDIESLFIFIPKDPSKAKRFRIVVGAGHKDPAPNNVLVMLPSDSGQLAEKYKHQNVLVEYGGHSSAPDMPPFGQFSVGLDVNWHIDDVWGTRDPQASAGVSFHGRYDATMTFPRDPEDAVTYFPRFIAESTKALLYSLVRFSPAFLAGQVQAQIQDQRKAFELSLEDLTSALLRVFEVVSVSQQRRAHVQVVWVIQGAAAVPVDSTQSVRRDSVLRDSVRAILRSNKATDSLEQDAAITAYLDSARVRLNASASKNTLAHSIGDILRDTSGAVARRQVIELLRQHLEQPTALEATASYLRKLTDDRLRPTYSLVPTEYLESLYHGIAAYSGGSDSSAGREQAERYLALITRILLPTPCRDNSPDLACGLYRLDGQQLDTAVQTMCKSFPASLACRIRTTDTTLHRSESDSLLQLMAAWNRNLWDADPKRPGHSHELAGAKHRIWEHVLYRDPVGIFRTHLFRPTWVQSKRSSSDASHLFALGFSGFLGDDAILPYLGIIIPAFQNIPVRIPGYLELQLGPMWGWSKNASRKAMGSIGLVYDSRFSYFLGWFIKGLWVNRREEVEARPGAARLSATAGLSVWCPCARPLHLRTGLRTDLAKLRPSLDHIGWDVQLEARF